MEMDLSLDRQSREILATIKNFARKHSLWVVAYGTGCGAIEIPPNKKANCLNSFSPLLIFFISSRKFITQSNSNCFRQSISSASGGCFSFKNK